MRISAAPSFFLESPAKINLGLEVLHRRPDGYHEVATVMQTVSLVDRFLLEANGRAFQYCGPQDIPSDRDLVRTALSDAVDIDMWRGTLSLEKFVPEAAGLGGGSSNAAAALQLAHPQASIEELTLRASAIGSDVPFFLSGGCALATGRGTYLQPLPDNMAWYVIAIPELRLEAKTSTLYQNLSPEDFSSGEQVRAYADALGRSAPSTSPQSVPPNSFERMMRCYHVVEECWQRLAEASGRRPHLSGAGPALYVRFSEEHSARATHERVRAWLQSYLCRSRPSRQDVGDAIRMATALRANEAGI